MALSLPFCLKGNTCQNALVNRRHSLTCELMWDAQSEPWVFWRLKSLASMGDPEKQLKAIYLHVTTEKNWGVCCLMSNKMYCFWEKKRLSNLPQVTGLIIYLINIFFLGRDMRANKADFAPTSWKGDSLVGLWLDCNYTLLHISFLDRTNWVSQKWGCPEPGEQGNWKVGRVKVKIVQWGTQPNQSSEPEVWLACPWRAQW